MVFAGKRTLRHLGSMDLSLWLLLSTVIGVIFSTKHNCTIQELDQCFQALNAITQSEELALAATKEELSKVCRKLQNGFRCIEDHSHRCFTQAQRRIFQSVVSESRHVIEDLCVPGELQEDYLLYAPCWKNVSTDEHKCALQYKRLAHSTDPQKDINERRMSCLAAANAYHIAEATLCHRLKIDDWIHCCKCYTWWDEDCSNFENGKFMEFVQCQHEHLLRDCGSEAEKFYQTHMDRMSGSLINEHCILFTHDSTACAFNGSFTHSFASQSFLYFLTLYISLSHLIIYFKRL